VLFRSGSAKDGGMGANSSPPARLSSDRPRSRRIALFALQGPQGDHHRASVSVGLELLSGAADRDRNAYHAKSAPACPGAAPNAFLLPSPPQV
jgi:hypothetical protein